MSYDSEELIAADYEYKLAVTTFLKEGGHKTLKTLTAGITILNRNFPSLKQEMASLRGAIDRMPRR